MKMFNLQMLTCGLVTMILMVLIAHRQEVPCNMRPTIAKEEGCHHNFEQNQKDFPFWEMLEIQVELTTEMKILLSML